MKIQSVAVAALAAGLTLTTGALPAHAHHSFAMFDQEKTTQLTSFRSPVSWVVFS